MEVKMNGAKTSNISSKLSEKISDFEFQINKLTHLLESIEQHWVGEDESKIITYMKNRHN